ncbi:hypothetical protein SAMN04488065_1348 [Haloplanus vescus]|uniref:Uncharacterized protein n=1 Tax=Haloplanus vescus TaxID=555874 RepID=A0A1H3X4Y9_9EURY|nr:hypothetical protein [Haloplanus vescus]SDZ94300.1 hypothetical protein SAMN04488065_1348 [Haloplanus vescus]
MDESDDWPVRRRPLLGALAGTGTAALAGCPASNGGGDTTATSPSTADPDRARELAERFAPTLTFDSAERWFPTDPRAYASEQDDRTVVDGFDAFEGYTADAAEADAPPAPTVFYHAVEYDDSPLAVVQFWYYSAFDQFATNFHWHDWEVLHVFVDTDSGDPQLFVASSHSGRVPNNEFLDPDPDRVPRILTELGSHSSALSLNDRPTSFQRLPLGDLSADITNRVIGVIEALAELPAAYGLPRDEGLRLPYVVPELDGAPIYDHERLPSVDSDALVPTNLTIRSFDALTAPPDDLPGRETGVTFAFGGRSDAEADVDYDLVPTTELDHIAEFTGPQLSFEFSVPEFAEDAVASHITTAGTPWKQERYTDPAADITEPVHRAALADRYDAISPPGPVNDVLATISEVVQSADAPDGAGVTTDDISVEGIALLRSDPAAVPTFRGVAMLRGVEAGDHRLTVNAAGLAPHEEPVSVGDGDDDGATETATTTETVTATETTTEGTDATRTTTVAGVEGEIPLVAAEDATKLEVNADGVDATLTDLAVDDDFGGRLYAAPFDGSDAVYVHRDGAYTTEVRDADDAVGAFRVNPDDTAPTRIDRPRTGTASLASFVASITDETAARLASIGSGDDGDDDSTETESGRSTPTATDSDDSTDNVSVDVVESGKTSTLGGLLRAMEAVSGAAGRAAERAEGGDRRGSDQALQALASNLQRAVERFDGLSDTLPDDEAEAAGRRFQQAQQRTNQAIASEKL